LADWYFKQLSGQWIDITGVPAGDYIVHVEINFFHTSNAGANSEEHSQPTFEDLAFFVKPNGPADAGKFMPVAAPFRILYIFVYKGCKVFDLKSVTLVIRVSLPFTFLNSCADLQARQSDCHC
jgi:hypothetical protein